MKTIRHLAVAILALWAWPALGSAEQIKPAPINPYNGMQEREEVYEFTAQPKVEKQADKWVITFASKANCDATVSIVDKEGKIVRHLASGVLGGNAPHPFQQGSLSQRVEWDGLTDTRKPAPAGCKVKVGLGLQAKFERNIWDVNYTGPRDLQVVLGTGKDGEMYVSSHPGYNSWGRVYGKDGKYLRTFWPPSAADLEKAVGAMGVKLVATTWGDKVPAAAGAFWAPSCNTHQFNREVKDLAGALTKTETYSVKHMVKVMDKVYGLDPAKFERAPRPAAIPPEKSWAWALSTGKVLGIFAKVTHLDVDPEREELYAGSWRLFRFDGKTGEFDTKWFPNGELEMCEFCIGPESTVYIRTGPYGKLMVRLDHDGKPVPFKQNTTVPTWEKKPWGWKPKFLPREASGVDLGMAGFSATQQNGFFVSPDGTKIVTVVREIDKQWGLDHGLPFTDRWYQDAFICVYSTDGELLAANAAGEIRGGNGLGIDRQGNIYCAFAALMPHKQDRLDGIVDVRADQLVSPWYGHGSLVKLRDLGSRYPLGGMVAAKDDPAAFKVTLGTHIGLNRPDDCGKHDMAIAGALWAYGGLTNQSFRGCSCPHARFHMDRWARAFIPANHLYSIMVLDSNGNRIARFGRYGNVDDADPKCNGIHLCWPRAVAASDTAFYVADHGNQRILKAALSYAAEETVPAP